MLKTTDEFVEAMRSDTRKIHAKVEINGIEYSGEQIKTISGDLGILSGSSFLIGATYSNSIKIVFDRIIESVDYDQEVKVYLGVEVERWEEPNEQIQYVPMGKLYIEDFYRNRNSIETTIELADGFLYMEKPYQSSLNYPAEIRQVALEICNEAGIEVDQTNFSRLSNKRINKIDGATCREAIGYIAQLHSGFGHFNRDGKFEIRNLTITDYEISSYDYFLKGLEVKEKPYKTDGIQVKIRQKDMSEDRVLKVGAESGNVIELDNPVMTQSLLEDIWRSVKSISFIPFELEWKGNPALEAGDWITITDTEERQFHVPQLLLSFDYNGGLKMKSSAQTISGSSSTYKYRGNIDQVVQFLEDQIAANGSNRIFRGDIEPSNPIKGDIWFKPNGPYIEMWIYEEDENGILHWNLKVSTEPSKEITDKIDQLQKETDQAIEDANNSRLIAEDAIARADNSVQAALDAKLIAEQSLSSALQAKEEAGLAIIDAGKAASEAEQAKVDAGKAILESAKAIDDSGKALQQAKDAIESVNGLDEIVTSQALQIEKNRDDITLKANQTVVDSLNGRLSTAEGSISANANAIKLKANQSTVDTITGRVTEAEGSITAIAGEVAIKANQSEVDALSGLVSTAEANIIANSNAIKLKANQTVVDSLEGRVSSNEGSITVIAGEVALKASKEEVDTITGRVSSAEGSISVIAGELALKASKKEVDTLTGRVDQSETSIQANSNAIKLKANQQTVDLLTGRVSDAEGSISAVAGEVALKASKTEVDTISGRVTDTETELLTQAGKFSALSSKVDDQTIQIGTLESGYDGLNSTVATLQTDVLGKVDTTAFSNLSQRVDSMQLTVADKADKSQVTLLTEQISLTVEDLTTVKNALPYGLDESISIHKLWEQGDLSTSTGQEVSSSTWCRMVDFAGVSPDQKLFSTTSTGVSKSSYFQFYKSDKSFLSFLSGSNVVVPPNAAYVRVSTSGALSTLDCLVFIDSVPGLGYTVKSAIHVLKNNINLSVIKGDVINQINVSNEEILIAGNKVRITGQTYIENAAIKSAAIESIIADKINTGILNAALVNVINLNANNISSGYLDVIRLKGNISDFVQTNWNGISNSINVTANGLISKRSDGSISAKYLSDGVQFWGNGKWAGSISFTSGPGVVFWAKKSHLLSLGYQGSSSAENVFLKAIDINGDTGKVCIHTDLDLNRLSRSNGTRILELVDTSFGGTATGIGWQTSNGASGIMFASDGNVLVKRKWGTWTVL